MTDLSGTMLLISETMTDDTLRSLQSSKLSQWTDKGCDRPVAIAVRAEVDSAFLFPLINLVKASHY